MQLFRQKFDVVDIQNATLAGGAVVGAVADLMLNPYGAFVAGSVAGVVSTLGFKKLEVVLRERLGVHDTCGVNNLHGIPGIISGLASAVLCGMANEEDYGTR